MPKNGNDTSMQARILRRKDLDGASLKRVLGHCPAGEASKLGYVIFTGGEGARPKDARKPVLAYNDSRAAFVIPRSPVVLSARGEVSILPGEGIYFIPSLKRRTGFLKLAAAAAVVLLGLAAGLFFFLKGEDGPSLVLTDRVARILDEGYQGVHELPEQYLSIVPDIAGRLQYADTGDGGGDDFYRRLDASINILIVDIAPMAKQDKRLLGFLHAVVNDDRFSMQVRVNALHGLLNSAKYHDIPELILLYRNHPVETIRSDAEKVYSLSRSEFESLGIEIKD